MSTEPTSQSLYDSLIFELTKALALKQTRIANGFIQMMFGRAARRVAELGLGLDREVAKGGLPAGARWLLPYFVKGHEARGVENIPDEGPLVIASNHPAAVDSLVISAHMTRSDYKAIIGDIPFFERLPHVSEHAIFAPAPTDTAGRMRAVRESLRHLKAGGALLIFARGGIEADPDWMPDADGEFDKWSRSLEIFLERVPQTRVLVTMVSGVISRTMMRHPITRFRKARPDRQRLAFLMQFARQILGGKEKFGLRPRVTFGEVIAGAHQHVLDQVHESARRVLKQHMEWQI
ncbi:MAG: hypothetical protein C4583_12450 [Anaerolineaceae bacterium]|nr:MAG: hypothetical protein C4583_12450 [Anaerolineaceae bacterium]